MIPNTVVIKQQFCGPPKSGNGGYSCGVLGQFFEGPAEVMLRVPPPLETPLTIERKAEKLLLKDDDTLVAEGQPTSFDVELPDPLTYQEAISASAKYVGFDQHHFNTCFVCGPDRAPKDGLRIFAGATDQKDIVASPWQPYPALFDESGLLKKIYYWAAMDCPSYFSIVGKQMSVLLLGKMSCEIVEDIRLGEKIVVMAWKIGAEGRKHYAGTALYGEDGKVKSFAKTIWISLSPHQAEKMVAKS